MSREQIVDKSVKKEFKVGKWYKCIESSNTGKIKEGEYYEVLSLNGNIEKLRLVKTGEYSYWNKTRFDLDSECDEDPLIEKELQTPKEESKIDSEDLFLRARYYRCIKEVPNLTLGNWYKAIVSSNDRKSVCVKNDYGDNVWWSKAVLDPSNPQDHILANLPQGKAGQVLVRGSNGEHVWQDPPREVKVTMTLAKARVASDSGFQLSWDDSSKEFNIFNTTKEESNMTIQRKVVNVKLIDDDAGLPVDLALVYDFGDHVVEDSEEVVIREIIMTHDLREILADHNANRVEQVNIELQQRTGNTVNLLPVVLKQLRWIIK